MDCPKSLERSGRPSVASSLIIKNELEVNIQLFTTILGQGTHRHLGIILFQTFYAETDLDTTYKHLTQPTMNVKNSDTQFVLAQRQLKYDTGLETHCEFLAMEHSHSTNCKCNLL